MPADRKGTKRTGSLRNARGGTGFALAKWGLTDLAEVRTAS